MNLSEFFSINDGKAALAFSGGTDSSYLLYAAIKYGADVKAYFVKSGFQPDFELKDAIKTSAFLKADLKILEADVLANSRVSANPPDRCYYCKQTVFSLIRSAAEKDGRSLILDGTNASDKFEERPGMQALAEMKVRSPLKECGISKEEVRRLSKEAGLFTWNKPAYACLATRIPFGTEITKEKLAKTEAAESFLFSLGLTNFRIRLIESESNESMTHTAKIQIPASQFDKILSQRNRIVKELKKYYACITLDLEERSE